MSRRIDWEAVELDYRCGIKSLRTMATEHGCAESAIRKKAKAAEWVRDLSAKIKAKAEEKVRIAEVRTAKVRTGMPIEMRTAILNEVPTEQEKVEVNAQNIANALLSQRSDIQRSRKLAMALFAELEVETADPELFAQLSEILSEANDKKLAEAVRRVLALPSRIDSAKKLSETLKNLIALERQALGLQPDGGLPGDTVQYGRIEWIVRAHRPMEG